MGMFEPAQALNEEGQYFVTNNGQTGVPITLTPGYVATNPFLIIQNNDQAGGKVITLDYLDLETTAAGSAASGLTLIQAAVAIDNALRIGTGGTVLTGNIVSPNMKRSPASIAAVAAGQLVPAAAVSPRLVSGLRTLRPCVSGTVADVVGELKHFAFSGGAAVPSGSIVTANPNIITVPMPPITIGPQQSALIYLFYAASTTPVAASYAPELGWSEKSGV